MASQADEWTKKLLHGNDAESVEAEHALLGMGEEGIVAALQCAKEFEKPVQLKPAIQYSLIQSVSAVGGGGFIAYCIARWLHLSDKQMVILFLPMAIAGLILSGIYVYPRVFYPRSRCRLTALLAKIDDGRVIPPLLLSGFNSYKPNTEVENRLIRLLPRLREEEEMILTTHQLSTLHTIAGTPLTLAKRKKELAVAALHALSFVGNTMSAIVVKQLLESNSKFAHDPEIREAAEQCLIQLNERLTLRTSSEMLLRASTGDQTRKSEDLVRPANGSASNPASELLRASSEKRLD